MPLGFSTSLLAQLTSEIHYCSTLSGQFHSHPYVPFGYIMPSFDVYTAHIGTRIDTLEVFGVKAVMPTKYFLVMNPELGSFTASYRVQTFLTHKVSAGHLQYDSNNF